MTQDRPTPVFVARPLGWAIVFLLFALICAWKFIDDIHEARSAVPTLSPKRALELEFSEYRTRLVDVVDFTIDCGDTIVDGERMLARGSAPDVNTQLFVAFEHADDCREAVAAGGRLRARVTSLSPQRRAELGLVQPLALLVEPHEVDSWFIAYAIVLSGFGAMFLYAWRVRREALLRPEPPLESPVEPHVVVAPAETDDRCPTDPYRTGTSPRLITETLAPAPAFIRRLRWRRRISILCGLACMFAAQQWGSTDLAIFEPMLGPILLYGIGLGLVIAGAVDRQLRQLAAVFQDPREATLELVRSERQVVDDRETGAFIHHFRVRDSELSWSHYVAAGQPGPLFLDRERTLGLALYHPRKPDYLLVLSDDLHELDRPPFSPAQLRGRFEAAAGKSDP